jgi:hypothetical protein
MYGLLRSGLFVVLLLSGCAPVVRPVVQEGHATPAATLQAAAAAALPATSTPPVSRRAPATRTARPWGEWDI